MKLHEFVGKVVKEEIPENSKVIFTGNFKNLQEENISWGIDSVHDAVTFAKRSKGKIWINIVFDGLMHFFACTGEEILKGVKKCIITK